MYKKKLKHKITKILKINIFTADVYNPFIHRNVEHPTSDANAFIHFLKCSLASGMFAMPMAFGHAGLGFGLICTFFVGMICTYCVHILVKSAHELCHRHRIPSLSFGEVAEIAFSKGPKYLQRWSQFAKSMINISLIIVYLGCCSVYIIFVSKNLKQVVDFHTNTNVDLRLYMASLLPLLLLVNIVTSLEYLAPFSLVANILTAISIGITFYYIFTDLPKLNSRPNFVEWHKFPMYLGTVLFALEGIGVVMPLENSMKTPRHFIGCPSILVIGMSFVVTLYASFGFFGFLKYGKEIQASITLNLPQNELLAQSVKLMITVAMFLTFSLQFYIPMEIILKHLTKHYDSLSLLVEYGVRNTLITGTVIAAIAAPNLGGFISLVGALCLSSLGLIFPAMIELATFYEKEFGFLKWMVWKDLLLIIFGLLGFLTGTYSSIEEIYLTYSF